MFRSARAFSLLLILLCTAGAADFPTTKIAGIDGAIIPAEVVQTWRDSQRIFGAKAQTFWTPTIKDVELIEARLKAGLEKGAKDPVSVSEQVLTSPDRQWLSEQIGHILSHYGDYRRQYVGVVIGGKRYVHINSFFAFFGRDYTQKYFEAFDGGFGIWRIMYSLEDDRFLSLSVNGSA